MDDRDELTLELAREALAAVSPEELPLIDAVGPELLQSVDAGGGGDGSLGFGVAELAMSTAVLIASRAVVDLVVDVAKNLVTDEAAGFLRRIAKALRGRRTAARGEASDQPALAPEHIERARSLAYERALAVGVDTARATLLADAIAGSFRIAG